MTMVGPTHGADGLGRGRGGGVYGRRLERDLGMERGPFEGRARDGWKVRAARWDRTAATTRSQVPTGSPSRARLAAAVLAACLLAAGCHGRTTGGAPGGGGGTSTTLAPLGSTVLVERAPAQFDSDLAQLK